MGQELARGNLRTLDVGLVKRIHPQVCCRTSRCYLPEKHLSTEGARDLNCGLIVATTHTEAVVRGVKSGANNGKNALLVFASRLSDKLFDPVSKARQTRKWCKEQLVALRCAQCQGRSETETVVCGGVE
jgi:hypothetical protein